MGDPQCDRFLSETSKYDYTQWGRLLQAAVGWENPADSLSDGSSGRYPLLVLAGDIVNRADRDLEWNAFFSAGGDLLRHMQVICAMGNRGRLPATDYRRRFDLPEGGPDWPQPEGNYADRHWLADQDPLFYAMDYGCCHFLVLDTNVMGTKDPERISLLQDWIREDLQTNQRPVTFALMHHPMFTVGTSEEDERRAEVLRRHYLPLLEEFGVDMILCGHQHLYCRTKPCESGDDPGLLQLMGVSGTKLFDAWETSDIELVREAVSTATVFHVEEDRIRLQTLDSEGRTMDELSRKIRKKPGNVIQTTSDPGF